METAAPRRLRPVWVFVLVMVVATAGLVLYARAIGAPVPVDPGHPATLPPQFAPYSRWTADVTSAPVGRAIALYTQHCPGCETWQSETILVGADSDTYRQLSGPGLLSPDGRQVAQPATPPALNLLDLSTGETRAVATPLQPVSSVAWSPDGRYILYTILDHDAAVLDLSTGRSVDLPGSGQPVLAAFAPDSQRIAIEVGRAIEVFTVDGQSVRSLPLGEAMDLAGSAAWSPDGRLLATVPGLSNDLVPNPLAPPRQIVFLDAVGNNPNPAPPVSIANSPEMTKDLLGWRSPTEVLVGEAETNYTAQPQIVAVSLTTGERHPLATLTPYNGGEIFGLDFQLAQGLIPGVNARTPGDPDRAFRVAVVDTGFVVLGIVTAFGLIIFLNRGRRRRPRPFTPEAAAATTTAKIASPTAYL
jgi:dipeptidyl aminopeptidase/acylaminoacyl peptidase